MTKPLAFGERPDPPYFLTYFGLSCAGLRVQGAPNHWAFCEFQARALPLYLFRFFFGRVGIPILAELPMGGDAARLRERGALWSDS